MSAVLKEPALNPARQHLGPVVVISSPAPGERDVEPTEEIRITMSETILASTVSTNTITVSYQPAGSAVPTPIPGEWFTDGGNGPGNNFPERQLDFLGRPGFSGISPRNGVDLVFRPAQDQFLRAQLHTLLDEIRGIDACKNGDGEQFGCSVATSLHRGFERLAIRSVDGQESGAQLRRARGRAFNRLRDIEQLCVEKHLMADVFEHSQERKPIRIYQLQPDLEEADFALQHRHELLCVFYRRKIQRNDNLARRIAALFIDMQRLCHGREYIQD